MTKQHGFTLVELLITIVVAAIVVAIAIPSFLGMMERRRLIGAADNLLADMRYAQAESQKRNVEIDVDFAPDTSVWNWVVQTSPAKTISNTDYKGIELIAGDDAASNTLTFDPKRNTMDDGDGVVMGDMLFTLVASTINSSITLQVTSPSSLRLCTETGLRGYPDCN